MRGQGGSCSYAGRISNPTHDARHRNRGGGGAHIASAGRRGDLQRHDPFAVTAGTLSFGTAPDVPLLPALTLNGQAQTLNAQMANFSTVDATGAGSG